MAPFFTLFCHRPSTLEETELVKAIEKYYTVFIDSELDKEIIKRKYKNSNHRFFGKSNGGWVMYEIDHIDMIDPLIVLTFDLEKKVTLEEWGIAFNFVNNLDDEDFSIVEAMYELVPKAQENEKLTVAPLKEVVKQNNEYMFSHFIDKEKDICICEIFKPFTDLPYSTVIENFSMVDFVPLFTSLFICSSWGVSPKDIMFLKHLWNHLDMKGEFDLENRLKKVVKDCENGAPEPRVYRETLEQVKQKDFLK